MSITCLRALRAAVLLVAAPMLPATLVAALPSPAAAQPACPVATVGTYLAEGFACQIAGWQVSGLNFLDFGGPTAGGAAPSADGTILTPFSEVDASGRRTFGFSFTNFAASATIVHGATGDEFEGASGLLNFSLTSLDPTRRQLTGAGVSFALASSSTTPDLVSLIADVNAQVFDIDRGGPLCLLAMPELRGAGSLGGTSEDECALPRPTSLFAGVDLSVFVSRDGGGTTPITGSATAVISRLSFTVAPTQAVPEPSTLALLAGGLFTLGAAAVRRRA